MLDKLRATALAAIAASGRCTLSTTGPAGVQASVVECLVHGGCVYVLVPSTADHLFNLEHEPGMVLTTADWQLRGAALTLGAKDGPRGTAPQALSARARAEAQVLLEVFPLRVQLGATGGRRHAETIDFDMQAPDTLAPDLSAP